MQLIDPTAADRPTSSSSAPSSPWRPSSWLLAVAPATLRETRRDRKARHESIPTYYGRLHFAH